jgi:hypothetical protein
MFGGQWGKFKQPVVTAIIEAIGRGRSKQQEIGLSAMQMNNLGLELPGRLVAITANGVTEAASIYNTFGTEKAIRPDGVRINEQLAEKLKVKIGDSISITA